MTTANLDDKATLAKMVRLADTDSFEGNPISPAAKFQGRNGYSADFLKGWEIPMPLATGPHAADMRELRRGGDGVELKYQNFSIVMSASRRLSMISAVNINGAEARSVPRVKTWRLDGRLDEGDQWGEDLYFKNPLDKGHMVRREDPNWGTLAEAKTANQDTFHYTVSCPQMAGVNQKTWLGLENYVLENAKANDLKVSVFTGPYFTDSDLEYRGALIPLAFWKVVAIVNADDGRPSATAYKISQQQELSELEFVYSSYKTYQISIRQVIEQTGVDFSALVDYDGFSQHEISAGEPLEERLDSLEMIRV